MENGLVTSCLFDGSGHGKECGWDEIRHWEPRQGLLWIHLDVHDPHARSWLEKESGLDDITVEALLAEETRPRLTEHGHGMLIFLRGVNLNPESDPEDMVSIRVWLEDDRIITTRKRPLIAIEDLRERIRRGKGPKDAGDFITQLAHFLLNRMEPVILQLTEDVDDDEDQVLREDHTDLLSNVVRIRRQAIMLRRYIAPQKEVLTQLYMSGSRFIDENNRNRLRENIDRVIRLLEELEEARDRAAIVQEEIRNRVSEQMNRNMYLLSIIAAIFLPLGFLTGLLGINVAGIPGAGYDKAFLLVCAGLFALMLAEIFILRRKRWF